MRSLLLLLLLAAGCASRDGRGLVPGQSTAAEVEAADGTGRRQARRCRGRDGLDDYPRLPFGNATYAARIAPYLS